MKKKILAEIDRRIKKYKNVIIKYYKERSVWFSDVEEARYRIKELQSFRKFIIKLK